jgi:hypothetical protein
MRKQRTWSDAHRRWSLAFIGALDLQALVGLLLYFVVSPITPRSFEQLRTAIPVRQARFFALEHITMMLLALVASHVTWVLVKRTEESRRRFRRVLWGFGLAFLILLSSIPWPWMPVARPLLRIPTVTESG